LNLTQSGETELSWTSISLSDEAMGWRYPF